VDQVRRAVLWRNLEEPGIEYCVLGRDAEHWLLEGTVVLPLAERPGRVTYLVRCDDGWATRRVEVRISDGQSERSLTLNVDDEQRWWRGPDEVADWRGLSDVDLGVTPATNTLPIRRLPLHAGEGRDVTAAWVRFPDLRLERLPQRYTRVDDDRYRYESDGGRFVAELEVDDLGLVTRYENGWERIATIDAPR